jgi:hypothetical protein
LAAATEERRKAIRGATSSEVKIGGPDGTEDFSPRSKGAPGKQGRKAGAGPSFMVSYE